MRSLSLTARGASQGTRNERRRIGPAVHFPFDPVVSRRELEGQKSRIMPTLGEIPSLKPQAVHGGRFPHVAQFSLPRTGIAVRPQTETPRPSDAGGDVRSAQVRHESIGRIESRGVHHEIGVERLARFQCDARFKETLHFVEFDIHIPPYEEVGASDVDVEPSPLGGALGEDSRPVRAEIESVPGVADLVVKVGVRHAHVVRHPLPSGQ
mmetsp:Transcript_42755/g.129943  ORF Transcript_42755/g.129943 Transcript_42755/m.129943 type:complete len:209 (-) Transcript_42755:1362-1988(-)